MPLTLEAAYVIQSFDPGSMPWRLFVVQVPKLSNYLLTFARFFPAEIEKAAAVPYNESNDDNEGEKRWTLR